MDQRTREIKVFGNRLNPQHRSQFEQLAHDMPEMSVQELVKLFPAREAA
jgi:hypothetical protein